MPDTETNVNNSFIHLLLQEMVEHMLIAEVKDHVSSRNANGLYDYENMLDVLYAQHKCTEIKKYSTQARTL